MQERDSDRVHLNWLAKLGIPSFQNMKILDLGCGSGFICEKAMKEGAKLAIGVDILEPEYGTNTKPLWNFRKVDLNGPSWSSELNETFDLILAFDIIEHLDSPFLFLSACHNILDKKGSLVVTTPNLMSWERFAKPHTWSGVQDPQHKILFTKYSLKFLLSKVGFKTIRIQAPMRSLSFLGPLEPNIGGQVLSLCTRSEI